MESHVNDINQKVAEYFVVAGLPENNPELLEKCIPPEMEAPQEYKPPAPITDLAVIFRSLGEEPPPGFTVIEHTPTGFPADLNHGSLRSPTVFLCFKRGRDKPPIIDIGVMYDGKERLIPGCEIILYSPHKRPANVNNSGARTYLTFRRASIKASPNELVVTDICIILTNKGESPPHAFMQIGKNLNKGMLGSDVYICYKKSMCKANLISHKPTLLSRYPAENIEDYPLPDIVPLFCLPMGATIECWHPCARVPDPLFSTFVLTNNFGIKAYGAAITFYEPYQFSRLTPDQKQRLDLTPTESQLLASPKMNGLGLPKHIRRSRSRSRSRSVDEPNGILDGSLPVKITRRRVSSQTRPGLYVNKAICLLSKWPFFTTFKKFLLFLYNVTQHGTSKIPIERYVSFFMHNIPFPSQSRPRILVQLPLSTTLSIGLPSFIPLSSTGASFTSLLRNMGPENTLNLLTAVLLEQKILIHSLRPAVLTSVGETLRMMIFPFQWQCSYIPLCPILLSQVLHAPVPYIIGVDSRYFDLYKRAPQDAISIDLDTNTITIPDYKRFMNYKLLPKKAAKVFRNTQAKLFEQICQLQTGKSPILASNNRLADIDEFKQMKLEESLEKAIQDSFIRFMACILKGYQHYLLPLTKSPVECGYDVKTLFDFQGFIRSREKPNEKFFSLLTQTQMFCQFVQERSFVTTKDSSLTFFDDCAERVDPHADKEELSFLVELLEDAEIGDHTIFIPPPDASGLPEGAVYKYTEFPLLDKALFDPAIHETEPRPPLDTNTDASRDPCYDNQPSAQCNSNGATVPKPNFNEPSPLRASPVITRTKHEIKSGKKIAKLNFDNPAFKARFLMNSCLSLWFLYLPAYVKSCRKNNKALYCAFDILISAPKLGLRHANEMCYRILLQLCGQYRDPTLAVRVLNEMKRVGLKPNAVTYGFYNKVVLESDLASPNISALLSWSKLRTALLAVSQFKQAQRRPSYSHVIDFDYYNVSPDLLLEPDICCSEIARKDFTSSPKFLDNSKPALDCAVDYLPRRRVRKLTPRNKGLKTTDPSEFYYSEPEGSISRPKLRMYGSTPNLATLPPLDNGPNTAILTLRTSIAHTTTASRTFKPKRPDLPKHSTTCGALSSALCSIPNSDSLPRNQPEGRLVQYPPPATYFSLGGIVSSLIMHNSHTNHKSSPAPSLSTPSPHGLLLSRIGDGIDRVLSRIETFNHPHSNSSTTSIDYEPPVSGPAPCPLSAHTSDPNLSAGWHGGIPLHRRKVSASTLPPLGRDEEVAGVAEHKTSLVHPEAVRGGSSSLGSSLFKSAADLVTGIRDVIISGPPGVTDRASPSTPSASWEGFSPRRQGGAVAGLKARTAGLAAALLNSKPPRGLFADAAMLAEHHSAIYRREVEEGAVSRSRSQSSVNFPPDVVRNLSASYGLDSQDDEPEGNAESSGYAEESDIVPKLSFENGSNMCDTVGAYNLREDIVSPNALRAGHVPWERQRYEGVRLLADLPSGPRPPSLSRTGPGRIGSQQPKQPANNRLGPDRLTRASISSLDEVRAHTVPLAPPSRPSGHRRVASSASTQISHFKMASQWLGPDRSLPNAHSSRSLVEQWSSSCVDESRRFRSAAPASIDSVPVNRILMSTCSQCPKCQCYVYEEHIMAGWYPDDSNLNTKCKFCKQNFVPSLKIYLKRVTVNGHDLRESSSECRLDRTSSLKGSQFGDEYANEQDIPLNLSKGSGVSIDEGLDLSESGIGDACVATHSPLTLDPSPLKTLSTHPTDHINLMRLVEAFNGYKAKLQPSDGETGHYEPFVKSLGESLKPTFTYQYLSPLVLEKEFENILEHEGGEACLLDPAFVASHPCVYWNLVWYFHRLSLPTFLPRLTQQLFADRPANERQENSTKVSEDLLMDILPMWDDIYIYDLPTTHVPLYLYYLMVQGDEYEIIESLGPCPWKSLILTKNFGQIIDAIEKNDLAMALLPLLSTFREIRNAGCKNSSVKPILTPYINIYRQLLWLSILVHKQLNYEAFDYEYMRAFDCIKSQFTNVLRLSDIPYADSSFLFRQYFCRSLNF